MNDNHYETATLASGCFWCTEAVFKRVKGVISVQSGFSGGKRPDYCRYIIDPKIRKLFTNFSEEVKEEYLEKR